MCISPEILLDEQGFVVVNKPSGMLSEGGGEREVDLEQSVSEIVGRQVWCCHRLDRLTSGIVVMRKGRLFAKELALQFEKRSVRKEYWLLVDGLWDKRIEKVESNIGHLGGGRHANLETGGKPAISTFQLLGVDTAGSTSWLRGLLKTGRTHQLRLHALKAGCPVLGDPLYGTARQDAFFGLHARSLKMRHPVTGLALAFEARPPEDWSEHLRHFES